MSVSASTNRVSYTLTSGAQTLAVPFYFLDNAHVRVLKQGSAVPLVQGTDYTITGAGDEEGGSITTIPTVGNGLEEGSVVIIKRAVPLTQLVDYVNNDRFPASVLERSLDKITMAAQDIAEQVGRAIQIPEEEAGSSANVLPAAEDRAGKVVSFDENGTMELIDREDGVFVSGDDIEVRSVSTLRLLSLDIAESGKRIVLTGYYSHGDFGSPRFGRWNPESTEDDNGGTIFAISGVSTGRFEFPVGNSVEAGWFGVVGDSSVAGNVLEVGSDNKTALQAAIDFAIINGIGEVVLPNGACYVSGAVLIQRPDDVRTRLSLPSSGTNSTPNLHIRGSSRNSFLVADMIRPILSIQGKMTSVTATRPNEVSYSGYSNRVVRVGVSDMTIWNFSASADAEGASTCLQVLNAGYIKLDNIQLRGGRRQLLLAAVSELTVDRVDGNNGMYGVWVDDYRGDLATAYFRGCNFLNCSRSSVVVFYARQLEFSNCQFNSRFGNHGVWVPLIGSGAIAIGLLTFSRCSFEKEDVLPFASGTSYAQDEKCWNDGKVYFAAAAISSGGSAPTHTSGTTDNWTFAYYAHPTYSQNPSVLIGADGTEQINWPETHETGNPLSLNGGVANKSADQIFFEDTHWSFGNEHQVRITSGTVTGLRLKNNAHQNTQTGSAGNRFLHYTSSAPVLNYVRFEGLNRSASLAGSFQDDRALSDSVLSSHLGKVSVVDYHTARLSRNPFVSGSGTAPALVTSPVLSGVLALKNKGGAGSLNTYEARFFRGGQQAYIKPGSRVWVEAVFRLYDSGDNLITLSDYTGNVSGNWGAGTVGGFSGDAIGLVAEDGTFVPFYTSNASYAGGNYITGNVSSWLRYVGTIVSRGTARFRGIAIRQRSAATYWYPVFDQFRMWIEDETDPIELTYVAAPTSGYFEAGEVINPIASVSGASALKVFQTGYVVKRPWSGDQNDIAGDFVTHGGRIYRANQAVTSGGTEPVHTTGTVAEWDFVATATPAGIGSILLPRLQNRHTGVKMQASNTSLITINSTKASIGTNAFDLFALIDVGATYNFGIVGGSGASGSAYYQSGFQLYFENGDLRARILGASGGTGPSDAVRLIWSAAATRYTGKQVLIWVRRKATDGITIEVVGEKGPLTRSISGSGVSVFASISSQYWHIGNVYHTTDVWPGVIYAMGLFCGNLTDSEKSLFEGSGVINPSLKSGDFSTATRGWVWVTDAKNLSGGAIPDLSGNALTISAANVDVASAV